MDGDGSVFRVRRHEEISDSRKDGQDHRQSLGSDDEAGPGRTGDFLHGRVFRFIVLQQRQKPAVRRLKVFGFPEATLAFLAMSVERPIGQVLLKIEATLMVASRAGSDIIELCHQQPPLPPSAPPPSPPLSCGE